MPSKDLHGLLRLDVSIVFITKWICRIVETYSARNWYISLDDVVDWPDLQGYADFGLHSSMVATYGPKGLSILHRAGWKAFLSRDLDAIRHNKVVWSCLISIERSAGCTKWASRWFTRSGRHSETSVAVESWRRFVMTWALHVMNLLIFKFLLDVMFLFSMLGITGGVFFATYFPKSKVLQWLHL